MPDYKAGTLYYEESLDKLCVSESPVFEDKDNDGITKCEDCDDGDDTVGSGKEDADGDGIPACRDCDDGDDTSKAGKDVDWDKDGVDQCEDCNDIAKKEQNRCVTCKVGRPVDYYIGTMTHDLNLVSLPGAPQPLQFTLKYHSQEEGEAPLGVGWTHNHAAHLVFKDDGVVVANRGRRPPTFIKNNQENIYYPSGATKGSFSETGSKYVYTTAYGIQWSFDSDGRLLEITDLHGLATSYTYNESGQLVSVTDPSKRSLVMSYYPAGTADAGLLLSVEDPAGNMFRFGYENRLLATVTYPDGDDDPANDPVNRFYYTDFPDEGLSNGGDDNNLTKLVDSRNSGDTILNY